jgi:uncharacterized RDD family membrane protein YckC
VTPAPRAARISRQGHYAGAISRLLAFAADIGIAWGTLVLLLLAISVAMSLISGHAYHISQVRAAGLVITCVWFPLYFAYQWSLGGKTLGMAVFGLRVVTAQGATISSRAAVVRTVVLPISIALFGLGLIGIVVRKDHRGWHDQAARTCVVYDWDAFGARLRWLARQSEQPAPLRGR